VLAGHVGGSLTNGVAYTPSQGPPSRILAGPSVKDLVAGSGLVFDDAGEHELKGVPKRWRLYRVVAD
jgi:class 3 adenylate cyclase